MDLGHFFVAPNLIHTLEDINYKINIAEKDEWTQMQSSMVLEVSGQSDWVAC